MTSEQDLLGQVLPRYDILEEIGRGGGGVVYKGWHRDLERPVAIKQLSQGFGADISVRDRFIAEAQLVAKLEHPHIVPLYDFTEHEGVYVIVMELATGSVWDRFEQRQINTQEAIGTVLAAAVGLHYAHSQGLLHRDVKPDNLLYSASGTVKIADFGIARAMNQAERNRTATGMVVGSPAYMAPEQIVSGELSAATDVYALGIVTYQLLSGQLPFTPATDTLAQLYQHVNEAPRPLQNLGVEIPDPVAAVVHRALHKDAADRPQSAEQYALELAAAGTTSFGVGWLERSGIAVMGSTAVVAATGHVPAASPLSSATIRVQPEAAAGMVAVSAVPTAPAAAAIEAGKGRGVSKAVLGAIAAALVAAVVAFVVLSGDPTADPTPATEIVSAADQEAFRTQCTATRVSVELCSCALTRSLDQLDPEEFRTDLAVMIEQNGDLGPQIATIFRSCVDDGF